MSGDILHSIILQSMKIYKIKSGILIGHQDDFYLLAGEDWDRFINSDDLYGKIEARIRHEKGIGNATYYLENELLAPIGQQEIWASGVTYYNSNPKKPGAVISMPGSMKQTVRNCSLRQPLPVRQAREAM